MGNDEKLTSRDDEAAHQAEEDRAVTEEAAAKDAAAKSSEGEAERSTKASPASEPPVLEPDFGMPAFGFFEDTDRAESEKRSDLPSDDGNATGLMAAKASLENTPASGTGWENIASIGAQNPEPPEEPAPVADSDPAAEEADRAEATVMPFPGNAVHRSGDPAPSDMLRGGGPKREASIFDEDTEPPAEALPDFDPTSQDSIADAVQSALRSVYGGGNNQEPEEDGPELGGFTVADSLRHAAAEREEESPLWPERAPGWGGDQAPSAPAARGSETDTDAVLDYLYGERRNAPPPREQQGLPPNASLRDLNEARGGGSFDYDEPDYYRSGGGYAEPASRRYQPNPTGYRDSAPGEPAWEQPPYVPGASAEMPEAPQYPAMASSAPESLAAASPDSSHLLGAAGLGLIGGIALAGVLAVFVFNSFVEDEQPAVAGSPAKIAERLGSSSEPPVETARAPVLESQQVTSGPEEPRLAAVEPAEPVVEEPAEPVEVQPAPPPAPISEERLMAANVAGNPGEAIPLDIRLRDAADEEATLISLKGLPPDAKLSTGIDVGGGQWLLPPARLDGLNVILPDGTSGTFEIEVELLKDDAQTAIFGPVSFLLAVGEAAKAEAERAQADQQAASTASAASEEAAQLAEVSDETPEIETDFLTQMLIRDGNKMMRDGDILGARRLYEQAASSGNPEAALAMGRSFDPSYFEKLPVKTGKPDPATAFQWYKKALEGGLVTARVKIDGLKQWLQR